MKSESKTLVMVDAAAVAAFQMAMVHGLAAQGAIDSQRLAEYLQALVDDLSPAERRRGYGWLLGRSVAELRRAGGPAGGDAA